VIATFILLPYPSFCLHSSTLPLSHAYEIYIHICFYLLSKNSQQLSKDLIKEHNENTLLLLLIFR